MNFDPDTITLSNLTKQFEFERFAREIDECGDVDELRLVAKAFVKLYFKHQEVASQIIKEVI